MKKIILSKFVLSLLVVMMIISCKKDNNLDYSGMRMFTPTGISKVTSGESQVKIEWDPTLYIEEGVQQNYVIEVSKDISFSSIDFTSTTDTSGITLTHEDIAVRQPYFARIKALGINNRPDSKWLVTPAFSIIGAQIFITPIQTSGTGALLRWTLRADVNRIVITDESGAANEIPITTADVDPADSEKGYKAITGLSIETSYTAEIFAGNLSLGFLPFRTNPPLGLGDIIDLTGDEYIGNTTVIRDTITKIPSGSVIVLKKGARYVVPSTVTIDRGITIASEDNLSPGRAELYLMSEFSFASGANIGSITFKNLIITGSDATARYLFNPNLTATVGEVKIEDCNVSSMRGVMRIRGTINIAKYTVNNSIIHNIGDYALITVEGSCKVGDISFTNSTFYNTRRFIVSSAAGATSQSITIANCTLYQATEGGQYLIRYDSNNIENGISLENNIFGIAKASGVNVTINGVRTGNSTSILNASTSYSTSDLLFTTGYPNPGFKVLTQTSAGLFKNPDAGDFTIIDNAFEGKSTAGDPRWRQ